MLAMLINTHSVWAAVQDFHLLLLYKMTVGNTVKDHNSENSGSTTKKKAFVLSVLLTRKNYTVNDQLKFSKLRSAEL